MDAADDGESALGHRKPVEIVQREPLGATRIVAGAESAAAQAAEEVHKQVVIFGLAFGIMNYTLENDGDLRGSDFQTGFLANFSDESVFKTLSGFDGSAGKGPLAFQWLAATFHQQDAVVFEDERANSENRALGIATAFVRGQVLL